ncbi:MAG: hypothetical protein WCB12_01750 [Bryobacteraceae bacterium]
MAIGLILTSLLLPAGARAQEAPPNLAKLAAHRESETEAERNQYTYRQTLTVEQLDERGILRGQYREVRDIIFSPQQERTEKLIGKPENELTSLKLTPEDFRDFRDIQPLVLTEDRLWNYETKSRGDETVDGVDCWVLEVRPRQILEGQRFFDGLIWAEKKGYNIVRIEGRAVPQILSTKDENLFPRFTTVRKPVDGKYWFPVLTLADDTLQFRTGPQRERLRISYSNYRRFAVDSTFTPR